MRKSDLICFFGFVLLFAPFFFFRELFQFYRTFNAEHPYITAFVKFFVLAPFGEMLGLRIRKGFYYEKGFGLLPRAIVWGFLGISLKMAFDIFSHGAPAMLINMGVNLPEDIMTQPFSPLKLLVTFSIGATLNVLYAPILMVTHKVTDAHIREAGGKLRNFLSPIDFARHLQQLDWSVQWHFVFKKTIVFFWIPAQTINFLLPDEVRILVAALLSIVLGVLMAVAAMKNEKG